MFHLNPAINLQISFKGARWGDLVRNLLLPFLQKVEMMLNSTPPLFVLTAGIGIVTREPCATSKVTST
jgi:hypothetical protein